MCEQQTRDVGTCDEQQNADRRGQDDELRPAAADDGVEFVPAGSRSDVIPLRPVQDLERQKGE